MLYFYYKTFTYSVMDSKILKLRLEKFMIMVMNLMKILMMILMMMILMILILMMMMTMMTVMMMMMWHAWCLNHRPAPSFAGVLPLHIRPSCTLSPPS